MCMRRFLTLACVTILAAAAFSAASAEEDSNPHLWKPRTKSVAVFKNGLGFFLAEAEVDLSDGWCVSKEIPPASFGTLAFFAYDENNTVDVVGSGPGEVIRFDGIDAPSDAAAKRSRLDSMVGLKVEIAYKQRESERTAAGKLVSVEPDYAIVESDSNTFAVPVAGIERLQVLDLPVRIHVTTEGGKKAERAKLGVAYLRKGITWIPEYTLKIVDGEHAQLTLRGTLVNEADDLIHCDVNFVVGVPHFVHTDYMAPVAVGQVIRTIGAAVVPREVMTQMTNRSMIISNEKAADGTVERPAATAEGDLGRVLGNLPQLEGPGANDYTVYTKKDLTVRRGEKAVVTLFTHNIKYSHAYRWNVPDRVEHSLVLVNSTGSAWTTGPCLALANQQPLSEDLLRYVARGASGEIPLTSAVNIAHDASESEGERKLKAHSPAKDVYLDLVTLKGELRLRNFEPVPASITVSVRTAGKPIEASDSGKITIDTQNLKLAERTGVVLWKVELKPDETKTLTYAYERYVPSQ